jgi:hypothetical protein
MRTYVPPIIILQTAIREYDAKLLLAYWLERAPAVDASAQTTTPFVFPQPKVAQISWDSETNAITPDTQLPSWVFTTKLVAKPDQLIKRRGKAGLLALNKTWEEARPWIAQRAGKPQKVCIDCSVLVFAAAGALSSIMPVGVVPRTQAPCARVFTIDATLRCVSRSERVHAAVALHHETRRPRVGFI